MPKLAGSLVRYPARITTTWFALAILVGTILLAIPFSSRNPSKPISVLDACFTATSAVCVTGLSVRSTPNDFTFFGQAVIVMLIQLGGIGIMTVTTFVLYSLSGRSGLRQRAVLAETLGARESNDLSSILKRVFTTTLVIEGTGIGLLWLRFMFDMPFLEALWHAIFHAISAFCNAGFALRDDSLMHYQHDFYINMVISCLIILGGIGFPVILDVWFCARSKQPLPWDGLHLHTKITVLGTLGLLVGGTLIFMFLEWNTALAAHPWHGKFLIPMFHSVSCRTAGFNTIDMNDFTNASLLVSILLMLVGGGACSTAGGVKVATAMMLLIHAWRRFEGRSTVTIFRRTIPQDSIDRAMASVMLFLVVGAIALTALLIVEQSDTSHRAIPTASNGDYEEAEESVAARNFRNHNEFLDAAFEVSSALGTVGLSTGLTSNLGWMGKCLIILLMFMGRLGPLSVFAAVSRSAKDAKVQHANEEPLVG